VATILDSYLHHAFRGTIWIELLIVTWKWPGQSAYHRATGFCHPQRTSIRHCVMYLNYAWMLSEYFSTIRYCFWLQTQDLFWTRTDLVLHELLLVYQSLQALTHWSRQWYLLHILFVLRGPGSSAGIATDYGLVGPEIESRWGRDFPHLSRPAVRPNQPPVQWGPGLSRG
jgi:hypothetical protein